MYKKPVFIGIFIILFFVVSGVADSRIITDSTYTKKIIFIGNSITAGLGLDSVEKSYPKIVGAKMGWDAINAGCSGATSRDFVDFNSKGNCVFGGAWNANVAEHLPVDFAHIMFGTNDATGFYEALNNDIQHGRFVPKNELIGNIIDMVDKFNKEKPTYVFISIETGYPDTMSQKAKDRMETYVEAINRIIKLHPMACFGINAMSLLDRQDDFIDELHPNAQGHDKIATILLSRFSELDRIKNKRQWIKLCKTIPDNT